MITMLECVFDCDMFIRVLDLLLSYFIICSIVTIVFSSSKTIYRRLVLQTKYNENAFIKKMALFALCIFLLFLLIISTGIILYCLFFAYECVFAIYDILLKYHVLRNI